MRRNFISRLKGYELPGTDLLKLIEKKYATREILNAYRYHYVKTFRCQNGTGLIRVPVHSVPATLKTTE